MRPRSEWRFHLRIFTNRAIATSLLLILALFLSMVTDVRSQEATSGTIQGTITDDDTKEALIGVTVRLTDVKGIGARTDSKGNYKITNAPPGKHTVEVHILGYGTKMQSVNVEAGQTVTLNTALSVQALQREEVVVMGLSGEIDRKKLGNAISEVNGATITNSITPAGSAIDALSGRVPGMTVSKPSGTPGAGTFITIRGRKTISGSSEPLYVVDGVVIDNSSIVDAHFQSGAIQMSNRAIDISSDNIENIQILKGPSAAALYGSKAANGVILITTKQAKPLSGESGKNSSVTFSTSVDRNSNGGRSGSEMLQSKYGQFGKTALSYGALLPNDTPKYNHVDELLTPHYSNEQSLSFAGGVPEFSYFISGSRNDITGLIENSTYKKHDIRANLTLIPFSSLSIQSNTNYIDIDNGLPQDGSNLSGLMLGALRTPPEFANTTITNPDGTQHRYAGYDNPLWSVQNNKFNSKIDRVLHNTDASLTPLDWLVLNGRIGVDHYSQTNMERQAVGARTSPGIEGYIEQTRIDVSNVNMDFNATATFRPDDDILSQFMIGSQTIWASSSSTGASSQTTLPFFDEIAAGASKDASSGRSESKLIGIFGQLTTTLLDRYTLTFGIRRDGSSTFGESEQFHYYPRVSFAALLPLADWDISPNSLSSLKLRGSYGSAGSPSLPGVYSTNFLYTVYGNNDGWERPTSAGRNGFTGIRHASGDYNALFVAGNQNINPEVTTEIEGGLDIGFWNDRISIEATYYHQAINDMILYLNVPGSSGFDRQLKNAGAMTNSGIELGLTARIINSPDFSWQTSFTYSKNTNEVTDLNGVDHVDIYGFQGVQNVAVVGKPLGVFYGLGYKRDASGNILRTTGSADDVFGFDFKNAPQINGDSSQIIGDPNPSFSMGWSNEFTFLHDFTFSFLFDGVFGQDVWNGTKGALYRFGAGKETEDRDQPWVFDGKTVIDNATGKPVTKEFYYRYYANSFSYGIEEPVIEKASYIKLREISLSYNWHGLQDLKISNVRFTLSARNLLTISDYSGFDPEVNNFAQSEARGFDYFNLPPMRTYHFGISLTY